MDAGLLVGDNRRGHERPPGRDVGSTGRHQAYLSMDASAQVPAQRHSLALSQHGDNVGARAQVRRESIHEADAAFRPASWTVPVDSDIAVDHYAVEHDEAAFCAVDFCDLERVAVSAGLLKVALLPTRQATIWIKQLER